MSFHGAKDITEILLCEKMPTVNPLFHKTNFI